jgi:hypothetical protein
VQGGRAGGRKAATSRTVAKSNAMGYLSRKPTSNDPNDAIEDPFSMALARAGKEQTMLNIGKLREANKQLNDPIVAKYLDKMRASPASVASNLDKMLECMPRHDLARLVKALLDG